MKDRRQHERIDLSVPCSVSAAGISPSPCDGVMENISRNGLLCQINGHSKNGLPIVGDFVAVDILLPARRTFGQKSLRCRGSVVRVSSSADGARIALAIQHMTFRSVSAAGRRKTAQVAWDEIAFRA